MRKVTVALAIAAIWGAGLIVAAAVAPFYESTSASSPEASVSASGSNGLTTTGTPVETHSTSTLLAKNGPGVLVLVGLPLFAVGAVAFALRRRHAHGRAGAGPFAWTLVGLLGAFAVLGLMSIGLFIMPIVGLLCFACGSMSAPSTTARSSGPPSPFSGGMPA